MYIIFATVILVIIVMFGSTMVKLITSNVSNSPPTVKLGNLWFAVLLIINISVIIFIYVFYYYKSGTVGKLGPTGNRGFDGKDGQPCIITLPDSIFYQPYNGLKP